MRRRHARALLVIATILLPACAGSGGDASDVPEDVAAPVGVVTLPDLAVGGVQDEGLRPYFAKQIDVFGVPVVGTEALDEAKIVHAANIMAQYLDNDEDGAVDDPAVLRAMHESNALLVMFADFDELEQSGLFDDQSLRDRYEMQDLEGHETITPADRAAGDAGDRFDAAIEEVWHLVSYAGYAVAYPDEFGPQPGSRLADAMDLARGGRFLEIPTPYPEGAWYTYGDDTCDYGCMAIEYVYWALSTQLGAQADPQRCEWISNEWRPCTPAQLAATDPAVVALLTDPRLSVPTRLPDGSYGS